MKTTAFAVLLSLLGSAVAFSPSSASIGRSLSSPVAIPGSCVTSSCSALAMVNLANGAMSFDHVCREWRCKYTGDKATSESLEAIAKVLDEYLPSIKKVSSDITVNRLVCGSCLDFKLMMTVPLDDFGPWEAKAFAPEEEFLAKIRAIEGVSQVETQTITNCQL